MSLPSLSFATVDNARVMPKGVSSVYFYAEFYFPTDERYDPDGNVERIDADYQVSLDSSLSFLAEDLGFIEDLFGMEAGSAKIGDTVVGLETTSTYAEVLYQYGLTDKLTIGFKIPYWWREMDVTARVDTSDSTLGRNPNFGVEGHPLAALPFIPTDMGGIQDDAFATGFTQNTIQQLGYERLESWSDDGIGDIELGGRYQYFKNEKWRLAFTGAVRIPTGDVNSPDNLVDLDIGDGVWALLFHSNNDYIAIDKLILNATLRYEWRLSSTEELRILESPNQPISPIKENVDRDLGDYFEVETSAEYEFIPGLSGSLLYRYGYKFKDEVSGSKGYNYQPLEDETDYTAHIYIVGLKYSTIPLYKEKKFSVPLDFIIGYRNRFAGSNNALKSEYISAKLQVYF